MASKEPAEEVCLINHSGSAVALHAANFREAARLWDNFTLDGLVLSRVEIIWASPDCKHFSKAGGGRS